MFLIVDLTQAWELVKLLSKAGMISRVPNDSEFENSSLDPTEERMVFDQLWAHYWPKNSIENQSGLSGVMLYLLKNSFPQNLHFNRQVQFIEWDSKDFLVYSIDEGNEKDSKTFCDIDKSDIRDNKCVKLDYADIIICTLPATHAKDLTAHLLPNFVVKDLENIQYESRASCSFAVDMDPALAIKLCSLFGSEKTEINFDLLPNDFIPSERDEKIHLMIWQDRKSKSFESIRNNIEEKLNNPSHRNEDSKTVTLSFTFHSTVESFKSFDSSQEFEVYVHNRLKQLLITDEKQDNEFKIRKSKSVLWPYSQPSAPMETLYKEVKDMEEAYPYGPAYIDPVGLILVGDYFTQSSYVGSFCSAATAVRGVEEILKERSKSSSDT